MTNGTSKDIQVRYAIILTLIKIRLNSLIHQVMNTHSVILEQAQRDLGTNHQLTVPLEDMKDKADIDKDSVSRIKVIQGMVVSAK